MIAKLTGKVDTLKATEMILNVQGVGYFLQIPFSSFEKFQGNDNLSIFVYTLHKEDQFKLFGFHSEDEKRIFSILLGVSGIGPAMALSILSGITIDHLIDAVINDNTGLLIKIPGIGKSKAEKLIFELKRKIKKLEDFKASNESNPKSSIKDDALEALSALGFDDKRSLLIVDQLLKENPDSTIENLIKASLKLFSSL